MNNNDVQLIRTLVQAFWGSTLGLTIIDDIITQTGLAEGPASILAVIVSVVAVVAVSQRLPETRSLFRVVLTVLNGVNRPPAYTDTPPTA